MVWFQHINCSHIKQYRCLFDVTVQVTSWINSDRSSPCLAIIWSQGRYSRPCHLTYNIKSRRALQDGSLLQQPGPGRRRRLQRCHRRPVRAGLSASRPYFRRMACSSGLARAAHRRRGPARPLASTMQSSERLGRHKHGPDLVLDYKPQLCKQLSARGEVIITSDPSR